MKIKTFLYAKTQRELHMFVEQEEPGVLVGDLCHAGLYYPAVLVEVWPGVWERRSRNEHRITISE